MTERETLRRAKELLLNEGWTRGSEGMELDSGPFCLLGSIAFVTELRAWGGVPPYSDVSALSATGVLAELAGTSLLEHWNDEQVSVASVISLLDRALASLPEDVEVALAGEEEALAVPAPDALGGSSATPAPKVLA